MCEYLIRINGAPIYNLERAREILESNIDREDNPPPFNPYAIDSAAGQTDYKGMNPKGKVFSSPNEESPSGKKGFPVSFPTYEDIKSQ